MVKDPSLKPTTAMKKVIVGHQWAETDQTLIRRWQSKWKAAGPSFLNAAHKRNAQPATISGSCYQSDFGSQYRSSATDQAHLKYERLMAEQQRIQELIDPPYMRLMREHQRMQDLIDPPHLRALRLQEQRMRDAIDPPHVRMMEDMRRRLFPFSF